jgi:hypothetical protein
VKNLDGLPAAVSALARSGDLVITLGAGSIGTVGDRILDELRGSVAGADGKGADSGKRADLSAEAAGEGGGEGG